MDKPAPRTGAPPGAFRDESQKMRQKKPICGAIPVVTALIWCNRVLLSA